VKTPTVAVCFGSYNRKLLLERAVSSIRRSAGDLSVVCLVADGGSTDGSREWLQAQPDCELLEGGLDGAVKAFNCSFARAVDLEVPYVCTFNDDDEFVGLDGVKELEVGVAMLEAEPQVGGIAWEMNTRGNWQCEVWAGIPYGNTLLTRREVGMAVARAQGDPEGKAWWDRRFKTYASDTVFGLWVNRLGWEMRAGKGLRVRDYSHPDAMHQRNSDVYQADGTSRLFTQQFGRAEYCQYNKEDAIRFHGRVR
jgi:glycosyltransferase involved in cell wall biosynthesis